MLKVIPHIVGKVQNVQLMQLNCSTLQLSYTPSLILIGVPINFFTITITSSDQATNVTIYSTTVFPTKHLLLTTY